MNKKQPLLSFIIPAFNSSKTLPRVFYSLLKQKSLNFEVIVVNDGSTDATIEICENFLSKFDGKLKIIQSTNNGPLIARLKGVENSTGLYISFLDSDDYIDELYVSTIEQAYNRLDQTIDIFVIDMIKISPSNKKITYTLPLEPGFIMWKEYGLLLSDGSLGFTSLKIYKNDIFYRLKQKEITNVMSTIKLGEDLLLSILLFSKEDLVFYLKKGLYFYVASDGNLSSRNDYNTLVNSVFLLDQKVMFLRNKIKLSDSEIISVLKPSIIELFKSIYKHNKKTRKNVLTTFYKSKTFFELFSNVRSFKKIFSFKNRIQFLLIRIKYLNNN